MDRFIPCSWKPATRVMGPRSRRAARRLMERRQAAAAAAAAAADDDDHGDDGAATVAARPRRGRGGLFNYPARRMLTSGAGDDTPPDAPACLCSRDAWFSSTTPNTEIVPTTIK